MTPLSTLVKKKSKEKKNVGPLPKETRDLVIRDMENVEVYIRLLCFSLYQQGQLSGILGPEIRGKIQSKEEVPLVEKYQVKKCLCKLESISPDRIHSQAQRELAAISLRSPLNSHNY